MKNLSILITVIVAIILVSSCKKDNEPVTKYVTRDFYIDSLYFPEATYIGETKELINMDSLGDTLFFAAPPYSKLVFTNENNTTIRYIGGYRDTTLECIPPDPISLEPEVNDTIYIVTFNFIKVPKKISYAILERVEGSNVILDTIAVYDDKEGPVCANIICYEEKYRISDYLEFLNEIYWCHPLTGEKVYDTNAIKSHLLLTLPKSNRRIYMMDIYPVKHSQIDSTQLVFFII